MRKNVIIWAMNGGDEAREGERGGDGGGEGARWREGDLCQMVEPLQPSSLCAPHILIKLCPNLSCIIQRPLPLAAICLPMMNISLFSKASPLKYTSS